METRNDIPLRSVSPVSRETVSREANSTPHSGEDEIPPYETTRADELPPYERNNSARLSSTPLRRKVWILFPTAIYTCMAAYSWVTLCLLSQAGDLVSNKHNNKVTQYRAARVLQFITAVTTIPIISLVCAWAAAVYVQNQRDAHSLRLRQVMTLADQGWMSPRIWFRLLFFPSGFKRYGTPLLVLAILMYIIGVVTYPIQSLFLSHRLVYVEPISSSGYVDFDDDYAEVKSISEFDHRLNVGSAILSLRNELQTAGVNGFQSQLWGNTSVLSEINSTTNWFAELSSDFSSGPFPDQYIPRVNSSASVRNMTAGEFPSNCSEIQDWFYASYTYPASDLNLTMEVCLPINGTLSPWKATDGRQDFFEVFYVNITFQASGLINTDLKVTPFVVTMNTTAGAFRLPSIMTNQEPGPLDTNSSLCLGYNCQWDQRDETRFQYGDYFEPALPGPLTMIALAVFGPGSFADMQQYTVVDQSNGNLTGWDRYFVDEAYYEPIPLANLGISLLDRGTLPIETFAMSFSNSQNLAATTSAFTQAGFLATKAIFDTYSSGDISVKYSRSPLEQISLPSIPLGALVAVSVLIVLYIIPLLCLALYSAAISRWTHTLDAFTMLRMGAAFGQEHLPFLIGTSTKRIQALDDLPGVVRDISGPDEKIRQLAIGVGGGPLQVSKQYMAYPGNNYHRG